MHQAIPRFAFAGLLPLLAGCATAPSSVPASHSASPAKNVVRGNWAAQWDAYLQRAVPYGFSGGVLAASGRDVVLRGGYGIANRASGVATTGDTVFYIGSLTKQFTAAAILKLMDEGKLTPQDPISRFLPNVPEDKRAITLHQLLTHSSGLPSEVGDTYGPPIGRDENLARVLAAPLATAPGTEYLYSNPGFTLLAAIIELVSGVEYERYVHDRLLLPAGMSKTGYVIPNWEGLSIAHGYDGDKDTGNPLQRVNWTPEGPTWAVRGAGNMLSTLDDMHRWYVALNGSELLSRTARELLYGKHVQTGENSWYGYGWAVRETEGVRLVSHNGSDGIFYAVLRQWADENVLIGWTNQSLQTYAAIDETLARSAIHKTLPKVLPPVVPGITGASPDRWVGTFVISPGNSIEISRDRGGLLLLPTGQDALAAVIEISTPEPAVYGTRNRLATEFLAKVAASMREPRPGDTTLPARMAEAIRASSTALGEFVGHECVGSVPRPGSNAIQTFGRLRFAEAPYFVELEFDGEEIVGASLNVPHPVRMILRAGGESELVGYDFRSQSAIRLRAASDTTDEIIISSSGGATRAIRAGS